MGVIGGDVSLDAKDKCPYVYGKYESDLIETILGIRKAPDRKGTLQLALESARFHCGIQENGNIGNFTFITRQQYIDKLMKGVEIKRPSDEADLFSALLQYFICLDQIGTLFYIEDKIDKSDTNGIINAINMFSSINLSKRELEALKNLRNSLGHAFGLVNVDMSKKNATHKFLLNFKDEYESVISLPSRKNEWNGDYLDKNEETSTIIYVFPLIRFIEETIANVIEEYKKGTLRFICMEEIKARFTILQKEH